MAIAANSFMPVVRGYHLRKRFAMSKDPTTRFSPRIPEESANIFEFCGGLKVKRDDSQSRH
jgi:hypothetical protein